MEGGTGTVSEPLAVGRFCKGGRAASRFETSGRLPMLIAATIVNGQLCWQIAAGGLMLAGESTRRRRSLGAATPGHLASRQEARVAPFAGASRRAAHRQLRPRLQGAASGWRSRPVWCIARSNSIRSLLGPGPARAMSRAATGNGTGRADARRPVGQLSFGRAQHQPQARRREADAILAIAVPVIICVMLFTAADSIAGAAALACPTCDFVQTGNRKETGVAISAEEYRESMRALAFGQHVVLLI